MFKEKSKPIYKGQLDEAFLRENFKGNHSKSINFSMPRKPRKKRTRSKNDWI